MPSSRKSFAARGRVVVATLVALTVLLIGARAGHGGEIVPSLGLSKPLNGDAEAQLYGGLAVRGSVAPLLEGELAAAYRSEPRFNDQLRVRMWPVTASLYVKPLSLLYAGAGVGWYHTTYDYASTVPIPDETRQQFGVHLGGGMQVPLGPGAAVDLNGRYVMMREQQSRLVPEKFDPDFWTSSIGLAIKF